MHLPINSTCLYLQLYCTTYSTDSVFETFKNSKVLSSPMIDRWYFIRFNIPQDHIRLRIFIKDLEQVSEVQKLVKENIFKLSSQKIIYDISQNTYRPEYKRYGEKSFELCEKLFSIESMFWLKLFQLEQKSIDKISYGILKNYCAHLGVDLKVIAKQTNYYSNEFNILNNKLDYNNLIETFNNLNEQETNLLEEFKEVTYTILKALESFNNTKVYDRMATSIIHMLFNRYYTENQRVYEALHLKLLHKELIRKLYSKKQTK